MVLQTDTEKGEEGKNTLCAVFLSDEAIKELRKKKR